MRNTKEDYTAQSVNGFVIENGLLVRYVGTQTQVIVPDGVRIIGEFAFCGLDHIESVILPDSIVQIGFAAFRDCSRLKSVTLPASVRIIADKVFDRCPALITDPRTKANKN